MLRRTRLDLALILTLAGEPALSSEYARGRQTLGPDYFGGFDFALSSRCTASALMISGLPCAHALSIIMRLKRHFSPSRVSSQSKRFIRSAFSAPDFGPCRGMKCCDSTYP